MPNTLLKHENIISPSDKEQSSFPFDVAMVLGKELKRDARRARRELAARSAAAARAWRLGARYILSLEAQLRGQEASGSTIVAQYLRKLGVDESALILRRESRSTREEVLGAFTIMQDMGLHRLIVITTTYHVSRAARYFRDHFPPGRVLVVSPEFFLEVASPRERVWILEGLVSASTAAEEARVEALFSALTALVRPLPGGWKLEMAAAGLLRRS